ncbi:MAG: 50S ribosomal protein L23 [Parcubacteria group bacterium]|nr:50S ribosomal protein L23 [Parcubacteria group bacterium]MBI2049087.1 50S ribosomal protein L23 [Parcubacteria group bacterium]
MALFSSTKKDEKKAPAAKKEKRALRPATVRVGGVGRSGERYSSVLKNPRITEKASFITEDGAYTFDVVPSATKRDIAQAMKEIYGVTPVKVRTLKVPPKNVYARGKRGVVAGGRKAIVYLKKGERIEFI